jgi:hypothetical protein
MKNRKGRMGHPKRDRQNTIVRTGKVEYNRQNRTGKTGQADKTSRTGNLEWD